MSSDYFLLEKDYTIYNALTWGFYQGHCERACDEEASWSERIAHGAIALLELAPIISQIISLFEMTIALLFQSHDELPDLGQREILHIDLQEPVLLRRERAIAPQSQLSDSANIRLPEQLEDLQAALFPLHRQIESQYRALPWPAQTQNIVVLTKVQGGRGDIAAAGKAIALMQEICHTLNFDWVLQGTPADLEPAAFLKCRDPSKVHIRVWQSEPREETLGDFLLAGPVKLGWGIDYIEQRIGRKIAGPVFGFMENAEEVCSFHPDVIPNKVEKFENLDQEKLYQDVHSYIFPSKSGNHNGLLPMGVQLGSGVFLDPSRIEAPLSRGYCCPSYLPELQDADLRQDILQAMNIFDGESEPDYNQHSFNSGYAHRPVTWGKFIDCVAIHEHNKHVLIVLNQRGEFARPSTEEFRDQIFTKERLAFLKEKGYGSVILKGQEKKPFVLQQSENRASARCLTVIIRPSFAPDDMRRMQLASERLLATGDNSAVEAWCSRCKLYLYEDVANMGCKWRFLQQQVDLAQTISPHLSKLLALFGGDRRLQEPSLNQPLSREKMAEIEDLLNDPNLSNDTLQFCDQIIANYSFDKVLEGALKRTAWHHHLPQLGKIEAETLDEEFRTGLVTYLKNQKAPQEPLAIRALPELGRRVQAAVQQYLESSKNA